MSWSFTLGRVAGTAIRVHLTFLLLLGLYAWGGWTRGGPWAALESAGFLVALFVCVLLHEFGHILMAGRFGVRTPDVLLLPIGGLARLERIPDEPRQEFLIAIAGPLVTLAITVFLWGMLRIANGGTGFTVDALLSASFLQRLMVTNAFLFVFNLIPAFPMDGGRVLRSLLAARLGLGRATRIASKVGQAIAVAGGLWAISTANVLLALICFFVFIGAASEATAVETRLSGRGLRVQQMMVTDFRTLPIHATLGQAVELLLATEQREFPVVDNDGRLEGLLTRDHLIKGLSERGPDGPVAGAMTTTVPTLSPRVDFEGAMQALRESSLPALPVLDERGTLVGLLTLENVSDLLLVRRAWSPAA